MAAPLPFVRLAAPEYGQIEVLSPLVRRIIAPNPGPFTYTGTGTYIIGRGRVGIIDPGPLDQAHINAIVTRLKDETITHLLITHTHRDHSPASAPLKAMTGAPTFGFGPHGMGADGEAVVEEGGDMDFRPDHVLRDGDQVHGDGWTLTAVHTPGHTSNHLCFALDQERALFTGDHVMGWSTTVISPPDGDMAAYFSSLERLLDRDDEIYYPTHGAPVLSPKPLVQGLIDHRHQREAQICAVLAQGPMTLAQMVPVIYKDVDARLHPAAARSVTAHLIRMITIGQIVEVTSDRGEESRYRLATA
jgi:glyoxylase-like metal-dependent hydrolase (beta-lactamase superfamily II)